MDSLTQIVLGASVGEACLGKKIGNKAIFWGAIAGTIPDLDVVIGWFTDQLTANELHRGFSHSILFSVLFSPLFGYLVHRYYKKLKTTWRDWVKLFFWGMLTHPLLDAFTTWGTQLFWPYDYKIAFKSIFVVDPLYTIPFLYCLLVAMFFKPKNPKRARINNFGIYISSGYLLLTLLLKWHTYTIFQEGAEKQGIPFESIQTKPTPFNIILWNANIKTEDAYYIGNYSLLDKGHDIDFVKFPKNLDLAMSIYKQPTFQRLVKLSEGWYTLQKKDGKLYFNDLRFGVMDVNLKDDVFVFRYELKDNDQGTLEAIQSSPDPKLVKPLIEKLYKRVLGKHIN